LVENPFLKPAGALVINSNSSENVVNLICRMLIDDLQKSLTFALGKFLPRTSEKTYCGAEVIGGEVMVSPTEYLKQAVEAKGISLVFLNIKLSIYSAAFIMHNSMS
jgi:hypothetical protein